MSPSQPPQAGVAERLSAQLAAIHESSYGVRPTRVQTHLLGDSIVCVLDVGLLPHEQIIAEHGLGASVRDIRAAFQEVIGATFVAAVERETGRRVVAFLSDTHVDPSFTVEFFRLGPAVA